MLNIKTVASRLALAAVFAIGLAAAAQAGTITVAPGATAKLDVGDRYGYTTITVVNASGSAGSLQLPAGSSAITVPAGGKVELYDRYGRGASGAAYVDVTNSGSVPLTLTSRYQTSYPAP
ncbi:hypothetical protein [Ferrovibrio terrae]|jgi:hypothetical protein|uniref:hypothetical protein n=1 Tax=Ferrovibrio terrae TaxID=2594003 RepID=UPI0031382F2C